MENLTGQQLSDQYILEERIGSGGMADVYRAWDSARSINMAIKVLHNRLSSNRRILAMFEKEASILKKLGHPNIARLYEFRKYRDYHYLVLEWVDGESLDKTIKNRRNPLSLADVSAVLSPIVSALHYLHTNDVLHCDIKPGNILIAKNRQIFLTDLGVARSANSSGTGGTPTYMAPEQFQSGKISHRTDIYSLGVSVYQMLSGGRLPFTGTSNSSVGSTVNEKVAWEHINMPLPAIQHYNPKIPNSISDVMGKALAKSPSDRFDSVLDFFNAYEAARIQSSHTSDPLNEQKFVSLTTIIENKPRVFPKVEQPLSRRKVTHPPRNSQDKKYRGRLRLVGLNGEWKDQIILIAHDRLSLGRNSQMQVRFTDPRVSRKHVTLYKTAKGVYIQDAGSSLGTYVNGKRIKGPVKLHHRDKIQFGNNQELEFREK